MSTRANIIFREDEASTQGLTVYQHYDGYPSHTLLNIIRTLDVAWKLPWYEADEFATAFVAANKKEAGGFRFYGSWKEGDIPGSDIEWVYHVFFDTKRKQLCIKFGNPGGEYRFAWIDENHILTAEMHRTVKEEVRIEGPNALQEFLSSLE